MATRLGSASSVILTNIRASWPWLVMIDSCRSAVAIHITAVSEMTISRNEPSACLNT